MRGLTKVYGSGIAEVRALPSHASAGKTEGWVAAPDPDDPEGRRLALADALGRIEVLDVETLMARTKPWSRPRPSTR